MYWCLLSDCLVDNPATGDRAQGERHVVGGHDLQGAQGEQGEQGEQGVQGVQGAQGVQGDACITRGGGLAAQERRPGCVGWRDPTSLTTGSLLAHYWLTRLLAHYWLTWLLGK